MNERIQPGFDLVQQAQTKDRVCNQLVPIIPIQMTEAWMLADPETLRTIIGTDIQVQMLGLPGRAQQVESDSDPKRTLSQAIQNAYAQRSRRRRIELGALYEPLARQISLDRLGTVPAYQQFVNDMTRVLIALRLAE